MSNILEFSAVITVKKNFNQFAKFCGFRSLPKMLQVVRLHLLVFSEKKIKMLKTAFVTAQEKLL